MVVGLESLFQEVLAGVSSETYLGPIIYTNDLPVIFHANHTSFVVTGKVLTVLKHTVAEYWKLPILGSVLTTLKAIPRRQKQSVLFLF